MNSTVKGMIAFAVVLLIVIVVRARMDGDEGEAVTGDQPPQGERGKAEGDPEGRGAGDATDTTDQPRGREVGNRICPVMGNPVAADVGFNYNGWWIGLCCPGCDVPFQDEPEKFAPILLEETGIDVTKPPPVADGDPANQGKGREVGNRICPVMGNPVAADVGFNYNGWWIGLCCPGCDKIFQDEPEKYAPILLEETGIDVTKSPPAGGD